MSCFRARRDPITLQLERLWNQNTAVVRHQRILLMSNKQLKWTTLVKRTIKVQRWQNFRYDDSVSLQVNRIDPAPADTAKKKVVFKLLPSCSMSCWTTANNFLINIPAACVSDDGWSSSQSPTVCLVQTDDTREVVVCVSEHDSTSRLQPNPVIS